MVFLTSYLYKELQVPTNSLSKADALAVKIDDFFPGQHPTPDECLLDHRHRAGDMHLNPTSRFSL